MLRSHLVFEMDVVMKELLGQLIAQFLVAQDDCHNNRVKTECRCLRGKLPLAATLSYRSSIFACTSGHTTELMDVTRDTEQFVCCLANVEVINRN